MHSLESKRRVAWLMVVLLCIAIYVQSALPSPDLGPTFPMKDKAMHALVYGVLAILFLRACRLTWPGWRAPLQLLAAGTAVALLYGFSDELHQAFVAARQADPLDLLADGIGGLFGSAAYLTVARSPRAPTRPSRP